MITNELFGSVKLTEKGQTDAKYIETIFSMALNQLAGLCPEHTREFSIVKTKLEEASFYAKKSLRHFNTQKENQ